MSNRPTRRAMAAETLEILASGGYRAPSGRRVDLAEALAAARVGTRDYPPEDELPPPPREGPRRAAVEVTGESSLAAASRLVAAGFDVMVLNFASAKNPGGGFRSGAQAQEESLARSSGLYHCLRGQAMYARHRTMRGGFYTDHALHSPGVPVFRDHAGALLEVPYRVAFLTAPAVNAGTVRGRHGDAGPRIREEMGRRIRKVLRIAAAHGHPALVLGAWGCGVFRNDPDEVARLFAAALAGEAATWFTRVTFAILDPSPEQRFRGPFEAALAR